MYISKPDELATFLERAKSQRVIAVDTEFLREKTFHPRLCLLQIGLPTGECVVIDPILLDDLSGVAALMSDDSITKVFHACGQDLEVINHALGCTIAPVFDTQLAAAFLGHRMQLGYGALVEAYTGRHLPKAASLTDWSRRPLDAEQLEYAEDDVRYLPGIYRKMVDELVARNRLGWVTPELEEATSPAHYLHDSRRAFRKLKRSGSLTRRQLAIAREVCAWRDDQSERRDIPRKWVLSDEAVVEACKLAPKTVERLRRIRGTEQLSSRDADAVVHAVRVGVECRPDDMPVVERHARPSADLESVIDLMYALVRLVSEKSGVATQLIATREDLHDFVTKPERSRLSSGWRRELVGDLLASLLDGQVGLTVKDGRVETL